MCQKSRTTWDGNWRVVGTKGTLLWDGEESISFSSVVSTGTFLPETNSVSRTPPASPGKVIGHRSVTAEFVDCVRSGEVPETIAADYLKSLAMVFACVESAEIRCYVKL